MKILSVIGARPQFIKCAPLSRKLRESHEEILVHTGQHYDPKMSDIFFKELGIPEPDYNLGIGSATQGEQTGKMLMEIEKLLINEEPDIVLVYGDTNSTIAGSLAASKLQIHVAHVEAGLRSFDRTMPEEINRIVTDHISNLLFCPTRTAVTNLENEGITDGVHNVGDVMMDALHYNIKVAEEKSTILDDLNLSHQDFMVATIHRASNTDDIENLSSIVKAFCSVDANILFPVHPRTKKCLQQYGLWDKLRENVNVISPLGYLDMLKLMSSSRKILTDSGGVQKEAYVLGVPCITMRNNTEWVETVDDGWNVLVGADCGLIIDAINGFEGTGMKGNMFGFGDACEMIYKIISSRI
ncbi:UDP-N-acetylglucosamine 2-epimerase (non-hydrolyzing) [Methanococcoides orientis]|uniref:non-hydrolyzing UDP-N-acetylglucosamine 2-epimerase n=1 Tax=Methanococcoides orientis TaxID=2822137 RepID=UPI001E371651|nr:UDP-N-acetylglucosamine 2-epimerase (non-hydrolyzing) [Methanococcoides orientis]UGV40622.1 UDP-N-acetylglucosamine 2-epimerase (non-hydrolyzing) [Methanococcoides orientis]